jgi:hypothetical protein
MTMQTRSAVTQVSAEPAEVYTAVLSLVGRVWSVGDDDIVVAAPPDKLVHSVSVDGQTTCWLSWEFTRIGDRATRVRLTHDELEDDSLPEPELDSVLALVRSRMLTA